MGLYRRNKNSRVLVGKPEGTSPRGGPGSGQEDDTKFGLYLVGFGVIGSGRDHRWIV